MTLGVAPLDGDGLAFHIAEFAQALQESMRCGITGRPRGVSEWWRWTASAEHSQPGDAPSWRFLGRGRGHEQAEGEGEHEPDDTEPHGGILHNTCVLTVKRCAPPR